MAGAGWVRGGREQRRGARRQRRARAPRLEEEEPGPKGGLTRFSATQGRPPTPAQIPGNRPPPAARRPPGTCQGTSPSGGERLSRRPRRAGGAEPTRRPGLRPAAALRDSLEAPRFQGAAGGCWCGFGDAVCLCGPRSPGPRPAARPPACPGSGATWLPRRGTAPAGRRGDSSRLYLVISASTQDQVRGMLRGIRQQEVSQIS